MPAKIYTLDDLKKMTIDHRRNLYENARNNPSGSYIKELIDSNGLALSTGGVSMDDPLYLNIVEIAWSKEGKEAATMAADAGIPAVAAIDRMVQAKYGDAYKSRHNAAVAAGTIVGEVMKHLGYRIAMRKACPPDCVAKSGATWKKL
ncbi:hypothetical protein [Methylobacterium sp. Leaf85]|uniref:hypothetical protein n=1 Tax=Methylobacterium sp. Leaf85 TaxID=1736241 RepID=UPI00138EE497|nr:hypothetical protein [Methylobacterium sp. Leaf85]